MKRYSLHWIQDDYSIYDSKTNKYIKEDLTEREGKHILKRLNNKKDIVNYPKEDKSLGLFQRIKRYFFIIFICNTVIS